MATLEVPIPATSLKFYNDTTKKLNKSALDKIYATYQTEIDNAARLSNVPKDIITSFIFIESNGKPDIVSPAGAIGLMQLMVTCGDILVIENLKKRFSDAEKAELAQSLGDRFTNGILKMKYLGDQVTVNGVLYNCIPKPNATPPVNCTTKYLITKDDLFKPALNILIGAIYLGILIDESSKNGKCNLHKVVIRYNKGYFADKKGADIPDNVDDAVANTNAESKAYILKLLGTNGTLDTLGVAEV